MHLAASFTEHLISFIVVLHLSSERTASSRRQGSWRALLPIHYASLNIFTMGFNRLYSEENSPQAQIKAAECCDVFSTPEITKSTELQLVNLLTAWPVSVSCQSSAVPFSRWAWISRAPRLAPSVSSSVRLLVLLRQGLRTWQCSCSLSWAAIEPEPWVFNSVKG